MIRLLLLVLLLTGCREKSTTQVKGFPPGSAVVRLASATDPETLDPRKARTLQTINYLQMLYEGLMRLDSRGKPVPGIAHEVHVSDDGKRYTFKLRQARWSNGDPVTAEDFATTWKTILSPDFPAPNAYQFYMIKGARDAKEGKAALESVGIAAPDPLTLIIDLEQPTPYFTELVSSAFFLPYHKDAKHDLVIANGPFQFDRRQLHYEFVVRKNPTYWDSDAVKLDGISIAILDDYTALRMMESGELDWVGSPLSLLPPDSLNTLRKRNVLRMAPAAGVHWIRVNTQKAPFNNVHMRKAFALAIDRQSLVKHVTRGNQLPALAILPPSLEGGVKKYFEDNAIPQAWEAFQTALKEMDISIDDLPPISFIYVNDERSHRIAQALQQQWYKGLGVTVKLERLEPQLYFVRRNGDYQLANASRYADFQDPINILEIFNDSKSSTNGTGWSDPHFQQLLQLSTTIQNASKRHGVLLQAEELLLQQFPVIPLYFGAFNYVKNERLMGVYFCDLGYLDFKYAFFVD